jgi:predicted dehydrogenase
MPEPLRVAVIGLSHDHVWWNLAGLARSEDIKVVAAWDKHEALRERFKAEVPGAETFRDAHHIMHAVYPDVVLCCDNNHDNVHHVEDAAEHGCHCVVEKPMADTLAGAERMMAACTQADVKLIINWPICWSRALWHAARLATSGEYGPLWQVRYRSAHNGPENVGCSEYFVDWLYDAKRNGPGAFTDYTCYGAAVCRWLQGMPDKVTGMAGRLVKTRETPADNAVLLLSYPKAISIIEASWTQVSHRPRSGGLFHCAEALISPRGNHVLVSTAEAPEGTLVEAEAAPAHLTSLGHYVTAIVRGEAEPCGPLDPVIARDAQAIMEAGWTATQTGEAQAVKRA